MVYISKPIESYNLTLNTEQNCTTRYDNATVSTEYVVYNAGGAITDSYAIKKAAATTAYEYSWSISPIILSEYSVLKVKCITHQNGAHGDKIIQFRLKDVMFNPELYRTTDKSAYPLIWANAWRNNAPSFWTGDVSVHLLPQTINRISLIVSDSTSNSFNGIDKGLEFIIQLSIELYDRKYSDVEN